MTYAKGESAKPRVPDKPKLALIHGWGLGPAAWQPVSSLLAEHFEVHSLALPGYSSPENRRDHQPASQPIPATASFDQTAEILVDSLTEGTILCGWSLGGMMAIQATSLAAQRHRKFRGLILVGSTPRFTQGVDWPHGQPVSLLDTFADSLAKDAVATLQRFIALFNQGDAQARAIGRTLIKQLQTTPSPDTATLLSGLAWLHDVDLRMQVAALDPPTLLIHGDRDPLMPLDAALWLNDQLPNSQLEVFSGAAHAPFLNDPERFARLIAEFSHAPAIH